jgi:Spy/CpxP family protein refolding chaperone
MKLAHSLTMLGLSLALGSGLVAQDAPVPPKPAAPHDWIQGHMAERLKLTDAQKASLKDIMAKHRANLMAKGKAAKDARRAFFEAAQKPETSADTLKTLHRTMSDQGLEFMLERRAMRQEIRAMLTPDQREQAARMEGMKEGMRMTRGGFGGMMGHGHRAPEVPPAPAPVE